MTPLLAQGLFHLAYTVSFFALGASLWFQSQKTGNQIGRAMGQSFFFGGLEYVCLTLAVLVFHDNLLMVKVMNGYGATLLSMIAIILAIRVYSYIWPKFPLKPVSVLLGLLAIVMLVQNAVSYTPAGMTAMGLLDITPPKWQIMVISLLLMLAFVPMGVGFIYKTFKKKMYLKGTLLGLGLITNILFMPVTYQVTTFSAYVFFSSLAALGFALLVAGVVIQPILRPQRK